MSNTDVLILLALDSSDLIRVLSPSIIASNLGMSREHASRRLATLTEEGYVEKLDDGKYSLSETGARFLSEVPQAD
jgi:DNA-binding IclR family transcriptional regulator